MKRSQIVLALCEIISKGEFKVTLAGIKQVNTLYDKAARLVNELEAEEKAAERQLEEDGKEESNE